MVALREPGIPEWAQRLLLRLDGLYAPRVPRSPVPLPAYATADLPPASKYPNTIAIDTTLGQIVYSDGSAWL
ncbi:MAG: hypothetical protein ACK5QX_11615 [bacterium]|jgi:hypothetical protein